MISYVQYIKAKRIGTIEIILFLLGVIFIGAVDEIGPVFSVMGFVLYYLILAVFSLLVQNKNYKELLKKGELLQGRVISSKRTLLTVRGVTNNRIKIEVEYKGNLYVLKSEYRMLLRTYKAYPRIIGETVNVLLNPKDIKNHYIFHEDLFHGEGFR